MVGFREQIYHKVILGKRRPDFEEVTGKKVSKVCLHEPNHGPKMNQTSELGRPGMRGRGGGGRRSWRVGKYTKGHKQTTKLHLYHD